MVGAFKKQEGRGEKRHDAGGVGGADGGVGGVGGIQVRYSYCFVVDDFRC